VRLIAKTRPPEGHRLVAATTRPEATLFTHGRRDGGAVELAMWTEGGDWWVPFPGWSLCQALEIANGRGGLTALHVADASSTRSRLVLFAPGELDILAEVRGAAPRAGEGPTGHLRRQPLEHVDGRFVLRAGGRSHVVERLGGHRTLPLPPRPRAIRSTAVGHVLLDADGVLRGFDRDGGERWRHGAPAADVPLLLAGNDPLIQRWAGSAHPDASRHEDRIVRVAMESGEPIDEAEMPLRFASPWPLDGGRSFVLRMERLHVLDHASLTFQRLAVPAADEGRPVGAGNLAVWREPDGSAVHAWSPRRGFHTVVAVAGRRPSDRVVHLAGGASSIALQRGDGTIRVYDLTPPGGASP
jgi:hypothetical protein